jgi:protein gp37
MSKVIDWVIIGAQTGPGAPPVDPYAVQRLTLMSRRLRVPVFHKNNLGKLAQYKQFPGDSK